MTSLLLPKAHEGDQPAWGVCCHVIKFGIDGIQEHGPQKEAGPQYGSKE